MSSIDVLDRLGLSSNRAAAVRRWSLRLFLVLIGVNAFIAIIAIVGGADSDNDWRVLGTSSMVTAGSVVVAANAAAIDRRRLGWVPIAAAITACASFAAVIGLIWDIGPENDGYFKTLGTMATLGVAATLASVLALPGLRQPWNTAQWLAHASTAGLAALIVGAIITEDEPPVELFGVLAVLLAAATVVIAVGARVANADTALRPGSRAVIARCPVCGAWLAETNAAVDHQCPRCGVRFRIEILDEGSGFGSHDRAT